MHAPRNTPCSTQSSRGAAARAVTPPSPCALPSCCLDGLAWTTSALPPPSHCPRASHALPHARVHASGGRARRRPAAGAHALRSKGHVACCVLGPHAHRRGSGHSAGWCSSQPLQHSTWRFCAWWEHAWWEHANTCARRTRTRAALRGGPTNPCQLTLTAPERRPAAMAAAANGLSKVPLTSGGGGGDGAQTPHALPQPCPYAGWPPHKRPARPRALYAVLHGPAGDPAAAH